MPNFQTGGPNEKIWLQGSIMLSETQSSLPPQSTQTISTFKISQVIATWMMLHRHFHQLFLQGSNWLSASLGPKSTRKLRQIGQYHYIHGGLQLERNRNVHFGSILKGVMLEVSEQMAASLTHLPAPNHFQALSLVMSWLEIPESLLMPSWYISVLSAMQSKEWKSYLLSNSLCHKFKLIMAADGTVKWNSLLWHKPNQHSQ